MALIRDWLMAESVGLGDDTVNYSADTGLVHFDSGVSLWKCRTLMVLFNYATTANYTWIFVEGFYLHMLLFVAVFSENSGVRWYIIAGWSGPFICIFAWIIAKSLVNDPLCWNTYLHAPGVIWIIAGPVLITIIVNFMFFINIIYALFNKLKAFNTPESYKYRHRRLAKSALVLIPLFGVPYIIFLGAQYHYIDGKLELVKLYFEMTFNSFNGFLVSLLYCFLNAEVQLEVRKKWQNYRVLRFGGLTSRRLATTSSTYAAVPANDAVGVSGAHHRGPTDPQLDYRVPAPTARPIYRQPLETSNDDAADDTVTSWVPDDTRRGCHGYGDVSEADDVQQQQGPDALRMKRLHLDRP